MSPPRAPRRRGPTHAECAHDEDSPEHAQGGEQRRGPDLLGVDRRDDDEREDVVDHDQREDERPQPVRNTPPTSASRPRAKAVSVDIAMPQPSADEPPMLKER